MEPGSLEGAHDLVSASRWLARTLKPGDLPDTLHAITGAAVLVLDEVDYASITVLHGDGTMESFAQSDPLIIEVDQAQARLREGPCHLAVTEQRPVLAACLAHDKRFPRYAPVVAKLGIGAQAAVPIFDTPRSHGALNLFSTDPAAFEELSELDELFVTQAAMAVSYAQQVTHLHEAVQTRQVIGQAVGVLMERYELSAENAFAFLSRLSQHRNVKVRVLAEQILDTAPHPSD